MLLARPGGRLFFMLCHGVTPASSGSAGGSRRPASIG
jgi:hypothetical protein